MRRRNPQSRFPNPIRRSRPILPGRLPGGIPIRRRPEWRSLRRRIPSRNLRGNPDLSLIPKRRPKPHSSPENPNRPPNPDRSLRLNPRLCPNRLRSRSLRPDLPLRLNRSSFRNLLLRQLRNPLLRRNPNISRPRCSEEETVRHRHKQRVIMSLYDTPAPAEKPARPETAERPAERPEPAARPEPAVTLEPAARPEPAATPGPTVRPGFAATPEPAAAPASAGPGPQSGTSVPQSAAEPVTVSEAPAAAEPEEAESGAKEVAVPVGAVLGEVINHDVQTLADTIAPRRDMASELRRGEPVADLRNAIGINDKFLLIRDLFGGDGEAYEEAIATLNAFDDFDECMIHIAENYAWNPNSDGAKFMMELLERKFA